MDSYVHGPTQSNNLTLPPLDAQPSPRRHYYPRHVLAIAVIVLISFVAIVSMCNSMLAPASSSPSPAAAAAAARIFMASGNSMIIHKPS